MDSDLLREVVAMVELGAEDDLIRRMILDRYPGLSDVAVASILELARQRARW